MSDLQKLCRILAVAILATCPTMVEASDLSSPADVEDRMAADWTLSVDPMYGWLPGLSGNMRFRGGPGVKIDVTAFLVWVIENYPDRCLCTGTKHVHQFVIILAVCNQKMPWLNHIGVPFLFSNPFKSSAVDDQPPGI